MSRFRLELNNWLYKIKIIYKYIVISDFRQYDLVCITTN